MHLEIVSAWDCHLDKNCLADPFWVPFKESIKGVQFLRYAFDTIQAVDPNDDFYAVELVSHTANHILDAVLLESVVELGRLDTYWERPEKYFSATRSDSGVDPVPAPGNSKLSQLVTGMANGRRTISESRCY